MVNIGLPMVLKTGFASSSQILKVFARPDLYLVPGWTSQTGRSGPVFKTLGLPKNIRNKHKKNNFESHWAAVLWPLGLLVMVMVDYWFSGSQDLELGGQLYCLLCAAAPTFDFTT